MWPKPRDPSITADLTVDAEPIAAVMEAVREAGHRVTPTAILARVVGDLLVDYPEINVDLRGGRLRDREAIDAWITMTDDEGRLIGRRVDELDERDLLDVQDEITSHGEAHQQGDSLTSRIAHGIVRYTPLVILRGIVRFLEFLIHTLRIPIPVLGISREGTGAVHITNVGPFGLRHVAAPIPPITGNAFLITVGEIYEAPVAVDGDVQARRVLPMTVTVDHRAAVGLRAGRWAEGFERKMTDPETLVGYLPDEVAEDVSEADLPKGGRVQASTATRFSL